MTDQQVVGYDPETGRAVIGYDPNTGKAVFAVTQATTQSPAQRPITPGRGTGYDPRNAPENMQALRNNAPMIGAVTATAMTGGAAWPTILAAGAGGAIGQAIKDAPESMPASDRFSNMALSGLGAAVTQGVGSGIAAGARELKPVAKWLWKGAAKVGDDVARSTQTMRTGGTADQAKDEIAETVLSQGTGTIRAGNVDRMRETLNALDDDVSAIIAGSNKLVSRRDIAAVLKARMQEFTKDTAPGILQRDALQDAMRLLNKRPARMTVQDAQKAKREIYDFYQKSFPAGSSETAIAMAEKTKGRALREAIATAEPAVAPLNAQMSRQIPATAAMEKALSRTANHTPASLSILLYGVSRRPEVLAAALANHPKIASFSAQRLYNAAKRLPENAQTASNIIRLASAMMPSASHETGR